MTSEGTGGDAAPPFSRDDHDHMGAALALAGRGLGRTWPNPTVGCVLVRDGVVVGRGWTQPGGRPHAETEALRRAGPAARGATAYVTLEPCSHHGKTPPCADALAAAGVSRVVAALEDPDPRVSGRGLARLRDSGVTVDLGLRADEAAEVNAGFLTRLHSGRPLVTVKAAATLDGRIATASGESRWITGPRARALGHRLRAEHDAIAVGIGTALADDPLLDCRLPGVEDRSPVRVVFDSQLRLPLGGRLVASARSVPLWVLCTLAADPTRRAALEGEGARVVPVAADRDGRVDLCAALTALGTEGLTRLLVEGGGQVMGALLGADAVDRLAWFAAPRVLGDDGRPAVAGFGVDRLADCPDFAPLERVALGPDTLVLARRVQRDARPGGDIQDL
ncbi:bifunctional diaminohydroxyphosphoribosylaminopyrimidine deaminase/5-amino-6-(5-phosphoribosylamino)uracil reductase RibD [uncultured Rhodospira sp.]|uniref:bifunctional diaminohydroxyphosphoribosylaminopyrimidine deaminase/5-amino-6-(5-phosphoribosylamino)uracil reductase RibD n=1 Tax=uncultured Rhodospira sp. TaxID=1936189 RepID=UPI00260AE01B|nr:bifunctional diaminohydroxyphosphoribosylaminopyrimidine deaminase/5-amino-6-(5-phosphoribosylamino)uracil reductase RibD [uncultured Rhodospira sp.]